MGKRKIGRILMIPLVAVLAATLMATAACTPGDIEQLKGVLQNVNSANGTVTLVTNDGKTVTVKFEDNTIVATQGGNATVLTLEPGATVDVKVKKGELVAKLIEARQSEISGNITSIVGGNVTIAGKKGNPVTVQVTSNTRIRLDEDRKGTLADLSAGMDVEAKYDPATFIALRISIEDDENENENKGKETSRIGWGILEVKVTDPPPADVKSAIVNISKIEVHMAGSDDDKNETDNTTGNSTASNNSSAGWITVVGTPTSFDLMTVIGVEKLLGTANITAGKYTQIRMTVSNVTGITTNNVSYTAQVPSDTIKIVGGFNVGDGKTTTLTLDFDGEKSLVRQGNGQFLFKPVVKLLINNEGKGNVGDRGESTKGKSGEAEGKGNSGSSNNDTGEKPRNSASSSNTTGKRD